MKFYIHFFVLLFIAIILISCHSTLNNKSTKIDLKEKISTLCNAKHFDKYEQKFNADSSYVIVIENIKPSNLKPFPTFRFFIYSINENKVMYEDSIAGGTIEWLDVENVIIKTVPRQEKINVMMKNEKIYNIRKKRFQTK